MYCINCGVRLGDGDKPCPLCGTVPFHPDLQPEKVESLYPEGRHPTDQLSPRGILIVITVMAFLLPMVITLQCDLLINGAVTWCGYVIAALAALYVPCVLPFWFRRPNPVIFVPCTFVALGGFLLYLNFATGGQWFLSFAFPVVGAACLIVTAVVTLVKYLRRGHLYVYGGAALATAAFMPVMEMLVVITFHREKFFAWSWYPMTAFALVGGLLIFLGAYAPARETMERKFFI